MENELIGYDRSELRSITRAFKAMDDEAVKQAKVISGGLADYVQNAIMAKAGTLKTTRKMALAVAHGSRVSKSSRVGELSLGFASQKFSGGADTRINQGQVGGIGVLAGLEFGSNKYKQFPIWSGKQGRGSRGWFIYPALRESQPHIVNEWENGFTEILKEYN
jgi:hypothetical protein